MHHYWYHIEVVIHLHLEFLDFKILCPMQGFDKYGIGEYDGVPVTRLATALGLKVGTALPFHRISQP